MRNHGSGNGGGLAAVATLALLTAAATAPARADCTPTGPLGARCDGPTAGGFSTALPGFSLDVAPGAVLSEPPGAAPTVRLGGAGATLTNDGVIGADGFFDADDAVRLDAPATVVNRGGGLIRSLDAEAIEALGVDGVRVENSGEIRTEGGSDPAIRAGDGFVLENFGTITSAGEDALALGDGAQIVNHAGGRIGGDDDAVQAGADLRLQNHGEIRGDYGVYAEEGLRLENHGSIEGRVNGVLAAGALEILNRGSILAQAFDALDIGSGSLVNFGVIRSIDAAALRIFDPAAGPLAPRTMSVENHGVLEGAVAIFADGATIERVENYGALIGTSGVAAAFGPGDDRLTRHPGDRIVGAVDFGETDETSGDVLRLLGATSTAMSVVGLETLETAPGLVVFDGRDGEGDGVVATTSVAALRAPDLAADHFLSALSEARSAPPAPGSGPRVGSAATFSIESARGVLWAQARGGFRRMSRVADHGFSLGLAGVRFEASPIVDLELFGGGGWSELETPESDQRMEIVTAFGGVGAIVDLGDVAVRGAVTVGARNHRSQRDVAGLSGFETATAEYDGWFVSPEIAVSGRLDAGDWTLEPSVTLGYTALRSEGYREQGSSAALTVGARTSHSGRARFEVAAPFEVYDSEGVSLEIAPRIGVEFYASDGGRTTISAFDQPQPYAPGVDRGARGFAGFGAMLDLGDGDGLNLDIEVDRDSDAGVGVTGTIGFKISF